MADMAEGQAIIEILGLRPHPEGGWFTETWREPLTEGARGADRRSASTAIYYLLRRGERSQWHRVDATEVFHYYGGDPLEVSMAAGEANEVERRILGPELAAGERPQVVIPRGTWQSSVSLGAWTLIGCTVAPGVEFEGFELAPADWEPAAG
jgi:predicted cupin superfamily sugar epimerase